MRAIPFALLAEALCYGQTLSPLAKSEVWTGSAPRSIPRWSAGAFLTIDYVPTELTSPTSSDPTVYVAAGAQQTTVPIHIPGAVWNQNRAISRAADGTLAAVGTAKDSAGHYWYYLVFFPPNYAPPVVVHTEPYAPTAVTTLPDGSVWTIGAEWQTTPASDGLYHFDSKSTKGILRHYSRTGALLAAQLPQSDFRPFTQAIWGSKLASSADRVGWCQYDGVGAGKQPQGGSYYEVSAGGAVSKTPLPPFAEGETVEALAITDNGYVLLAKSARGTNPRLYALDRSQGTWHALAFPAAGFEGTGYFLLGATGNTLAFWTSGKQGFNAQFASIE
jgi:hypothetical protein